MTDQVSKAQDPKPGENPAQSVRRRPRVPMSSARQRLQAPEIPGYRQYWFREDNVDAALEAWYEFSRPEDVHLNQLNVANAAGESGGTDMGSRVSLVADKNEAGAPVRAYLMKIKLEYYKEDQADLARRNASVLEAMFGAEASADVSVDDQGRVVFKDRDVHTYVDPDRTGIFNKKTRKVNKRGSIGVMSRQ